MTEKRFSVGLRKCTTQYELIDNYKTGEYPFIEPFYYEKSAKDLAKFLNALNDENEQLKQDCKNYTRYKQVKTLTNENEQLKQEIKELQGKASSWKITASEEMMKQSELMKENEQLKSHINDTEIAVEIETEKCMQKVFDCIDKKIKFVETCNEMYKTNPDYYRGAFDILKLLKKELIE